MSDEKFFPPRPEARPMIYAYADTNPQYAGLLKVGYTITPKRTQELMQQADANFLFAKKESLTKKTENR